MLPASPWIVSVPLAGPAAVPFIHIVTLALWPAFIVAGRVRPDSVNCVLEKSARIIVCATVSLLVIVTVCELFCPTATLPKFTLMGEMLKLVAEDCCLPPTNPAQPFKNGRRSNRRAKKFLVSQPNDALSSVLDPQPTVAT